MLTIGTLANIKHILQKELFNGSGSGERLLSVVTVTKTFKKKDKRACYLCVVTTAPPVPVVTLYLVKQSEQRESEYKRKRSWQLDEIKWVDGRNEQFETHEFDIQLEKLYKWYALNLHERQNFLAVLLLPVTSGHWQVVHGGVLVVLATVVGSTRHGANCNRVE